VAQNSRLCAATRSRTEPSELLRVFYPGPSRAACHLVSHVWKHDSNKPEHIPWIDTCDTAGASGSKERQQTDENGSEKRSIAWLLCTLPTPWRNRIVPTTRKTAPICHRPQKLRSDNHCSCPQALPKQTKRQSSGTQRSLPSAQEKCFAMSRAAAPGATGGGGEPPSVASHFSEILIQGLPARRAPRATE
jgi:hypothetical protein